MFQNARIKVTSVVELEDAQVDAIRQINYDRDQEIKSGVTFAGETYQSDSQSIQDLTALATLSTIDPNITAPWLTEDNTTVILDATQIQSLALQFATHKTTKVLEARAKKDAVLAASTKEEVLAILNQ